FFGTELSHDEGRSADISDLRHASPPKNESWAEATRCVRACVRSDLPFRGRDRIGAGMLVPRSLTVAVRKSLLALLLIPLFPAPLRSRFGKAFSHTFQTAVAARKSVLAHFLNTLVPRSLTVAVRTRLLPPGKAFPHTV